MTRWVTAEELRAASGLSRAELRALEDVGLLLSMHTDPALPIGDPLMWACRASIN